MSNTSMPSWWPSSCRRSRPVDWFSSVGTVPVGAPSPIKAGGAWAWSESLRALVLRVRVAGRVVVRVARTTVRDVAVKALNIFLSWARSGACGTSWRLFLVTSRDSFNDSQRFLFPVINRSLVLTGVVGIRCIKSCGRGWYLREFQRAADFLRLPDRATESASEVGMCIAFVSWRGAHMVILREHAASRLLPPFSYNTGVVVWVAPLSGPFCRS